MRRTTRKRNPSARTHDIALKGRRTPEAAPNSMQFFAQVEGVPEPSGHLRGANGMRWRLP